MRDSIDRAAQQVALEAADGNPKYSHDDGLAAGVSKKRLLDDVLAPASKRHKKNKADERVNAKDGNRVSRDRKQHTEVCPYLLHS